MSNFIKDLCVGSLTLILLISIPVSVYFSKNDGFGVVAGGLWGLLNIYFLKELLLNILIESRKLMKCLIILIAKIPLIYGIGFWLLSSNIFSYWSLSLGFFMNIVVVLGMGYRKKGFV